MTLKPTVVVIDDPYVSITPTNQCAGCQLGLDVDKVGLHIDEDGNIFCSCTRHQYDWSFDNLRQIPIMSSDEFKTQFQTIMSKDV